LDQPAIQRRGDRTRSDKTFIWFRRALTASWPPGGLAQAPEIRSPAAAVKGELAAGKRARPGLVAGTEGLALIRRIGGKESINYMSDINA
jgi:hypothetical protein